jgi:hypothetical protein
VKEQIHLRDFKNFPSQQMLLAVNPIDLPGDPAKKED